MRVLRVSIAASRLVVRVQRVDWDGILGQFFPPSGPRGAIPASPGLARTIHDAFGQVVQVRAETRKATEARGGRFDDLESLSTELDAVSACSCAIWREWS